MLNAKLGSGTSGRMTITLKEKAPLVVPATVQRRAGIKAGDRVQFRAAQGMITIVTSPQPAADDEEYAPEQRRAINAQLAESLEDVRKGRVYGPFVAVAELERSLRRTARKSAAKAQRSARR